MSRNAAAATMPAAMLDPPPPGMLHPASFALTFLFPILLGSPQSAAMKLQFDATMPDQSKPGTLPSLTAPHLSPFPGTMLWQFVGDAPHSVKYELTVLPSTSRPGVIGSVIGMQPNKALSPLAEPSYTSFQIAPSPRCHITHPLLWEKYWAFAFWRLTRICDRILLKDFPPELENTISALPKTCESILGNLWGAAPRFTLFPLSSGLWSPKKILCRPKGTLKGAGSSVRQSLATFSSDHGAIEHISPSLRNERVLCTPLINPDTPWENIALPTHNVVEGISLLQEGSLTSLTAPKRRGEYRKPIESHHPGQKTFQNHPKTATRRSDTHVGTTNKSCPRQNPAIPLANNSGGLLKVKDALKTPPLSHKRLSRVAKKPKAH